MMSPKKQMALNNGITLIELVVTVAISAILVTLAGPSLRDIYQEANNRHSANSLYTALTYARDEAMTRNTRVTLCKSKDGATCDSTATWNDYWVVLTDGGNDTSTGTIGAVDTGEEVLRTFRRKDSQLKFGGMDDVKSYVSFTSAGEPRLSSGKLVDESKSHFSICSLDGGEYSLTAASSRVLSVTKSGRLYVTKPDCYSEVTACL